MTAPRPLSERALREAAQVARQEGVAITVERGPDGAWVYKVAPQQPHENTNPADLIEP